MYFRGLLVLAVAAPCEALLGRFWRAQPKPTQGHIHLPHTRDVPSDGHLGFVLTDDTEDATPNFEARVTAVGGSFVA